MTVHCHDKSKIYLRLVEHILNHSTPNFDRISNSVEIPLVGILYKLNVTDFSVSLLFGVFCFRWYLNIFTFVAIFVFSQISEHFHLCWHFCFLSDLWAFSPLLAFLFSLRSLSIFTFVGVFVFSQISEHFHLCWHFCFLSDLWAFSPLLVVLLFYIWTTLLSVLKDSHHTHISHPQYIRISTSCFNEKNKVLCDIVSWLHHYMEMLSILLLWETALATRGFLSKRTIKTGFWCFL